MNKEYSKAKVILVISQRKVARLFYFSNFREWELTKGVKKYLKTPTLQSEH